MGKLKKIDKHFYEYTHTDKAGIESIGYYGIFTDWTSTPRRFALGDSETEARDRLGELRRLNRAHFDFDNEEKKRQEKKRKSVTFGEFCDAYFDAMVPQGRDFITWSGVKRLNTFRAERRAAALLKEFFADVPLSAINSLMIKTFQQKLSIKMKVNSVNRTLGFLNYLLNLACERNVLDNAPRIKRASEKGFHRTRSVSPEEYAAILAHLRRPAARLLVAYWETGARRQELVNLKWSMVDLKNDLLRLPPEILKEKVARRVPISWELRQVLVELMQEKLRTNLNHDFVFIRNDGKHIRSIVKAFEAARERAGLPDVMIHSFRRACLTRWTDAGIPTDIVKRASGHTDGSVHGHYLVFSDAMITRPFREKGFMLPPEKRKTVEAA